jgi:hypothetical protein
LGGGAWAQQTEAEAPTGTVWPTIPGTNPAVSFPSTILPATVSKSAVNSVTAGLFATDIDNSLNVSNYGKVQFDKLYLFLGGTPAINGLTGGAATKVGDNYFAFYTSGNFSPRSGKDVWEEDDVADTEKYEDSIFRWNNVFSFLWGSPTLGGIRLDLAFNDSSANNNYTQKKGDTYTENKTFVTALRWSGLKFGDLILKPTLAFQWPAYTKTVSNADPAPAGDDTVKKWENAALDLKLEAGFGKMAVSYELLANFGSTTKGSYTQKEFKYTLSGYAVHTLQFDYTVTKDIDEKIQLKAKPKVKAELLGRNVKSTTENENSSVDQDSGTMTAFRLTPALDLGVSWKLLPKLAFYTGTSVTPFTLTTLNTEKGDDNSYFQNEKKSYLSSLITIGSLNFGFEFNPTPALGIEFSLNDVINPNSSTYGLDLTSLAGRFAVKIKL